MNIPATERSKPTLLLLFLTPRPTRMGPQTQVVSGVGTLRAGGHRSWTHEQLWALLPPAWVVSSRAGEQGWQGAPLESPLRALNAEPNQSDAPGRKISPSFRELPAVFPPPLLYFFFYIHRCSDYFILMQINQIIADISAVFSKRARIKARELQRHPRERATLWGSPGRQADCCFRGSSGWGVGPGYHCPQEGSPDRGWEWGRPTAGPGEGRTRATTPVPWGRRQHCLASTLSSPSGDRRHVSGLSRWSLPPGAQSPGAPVPPPRPGGEGRRRGAPAGGAPTGPGSCRRPGAGRPSCAPADTACLCAGGASSCPPVREWFVYAGNPLRHPDLVRPLQMSIPGTDRPRAH